MKKAQILFDVEVMADILLGQHLRQNLNIKVTGFKVRSDGLVAMDLEGDGLPDKCNDENTYTRLRLNREVVMTDNGPQPVITHTILTTYKEKTI